MVFGTKLVDDGHFVLNSDERNALLHECPDVKPFLRTFIGGEEFLNGSERWVIWLTNAPPALVRNCRSLRERVERVRQFRLASKKQPTVELGKTPCAVGEDRQPDKDYLLFPKVSSERRRHVPLGFLPASVVANGSSLIVPGASLYHFGVLSSEMHMAWMRQVAGRLESRYQYSGTIVYNTFSWPEAGSAKQRAAVETAAQAVLDARKQFPDATLADLYDPLAMPPALAKAHAELDRAVDRCYRSQPFESDRQRVEYLFALYEKLTAPLVPPVKKARKRS
jgi:hypothetical protein